jgi:hypothetical protein
LTGVAKNMAGQILPEFFNKAGEPIKIPTAFVAVVKAAVRGANCVACTHQHYVTAPKVVVASTAGITSVDAERPGTLAESA